MDHDESRAGERDASLGVGRAGGATRDPDGSMRSFAVAAARSLRDDKCEDVQVLDLRGLSGVTDYFVIASGTSERQMKSAGQHVKELGEERSVGLHHSNLRDTEGSWVLMDFVDVVVHVFDPERRRFYDLEMLWGDAPRVAWSEDGGDAGEGGGGGGPNRAGLRPDDVIE